jgi:hypothetical protein
MTKGKGAGLTSSSSESAGDGAPKERSARKRPASALAQAAAASKSANGTARRQQQQQSSGNKSFDPRFSPFVRHGPAIKQNDQHKFGFVNELAAADEEKRKVRIRALRQEQQYRARERRQDGGGDADDYQQEDDDDDDNAADDYDSDDDYQDLYALADDDRVRVGLMDDSELDAELAELKRKSGAFKMRQGEQRAAERKGSAKRDWAKKQFSAVKGGQQKQAFFLNRKKLQQHETKERLRDLAANKGKHAESAYVEKQLKKRFAAKHLR